MEDKMSKKLVIGLVLLIFLLISAFLIFKSVNQKSIPSVERKEGSQEYLPEVREEKSEMEKKRELGRVFREKLLKELEGH